jgi:hypothetical protein
MEGQAKVSLRNIPFVDEGPAVVGVVEAPGVVMTTMLVVVGTALEALG